MTTTRLFLTALLTGAALLNLSAPAQAQNQVISGEQLKTMWVGKKVFARSAKGGLIDLYLKADGTSQVAVGKMVDSGTWSPTESGYCAKWKRIRAGEEQCFKVVSRDGKVLVLDLDGSLSTEVLQVVD